MDMGDLSEALKNQLEFIAKLNADMAMEAQSQQPGSVAGTPKRVMQSDPVGNEAVGRLHVENINNKDVDMSLEEELEIGELEIVKKEITPLAKRLAPALANVQKSVQVPVRQRTAQTRVAHAPEKKLTFLLPETPIESRRLEEQQSLMTPRVLGVGIDEDGLHDADTSTTPGVKSGTPMAIEVLTNLYSLGLQEGGMGIVNDFVEGKKAVSVLDVEYVFSDCASSCTNNFNLTDNAVGSRYEGVTRQWLEFQQDCKGCCCCCCCYKEAKAQEGWSQNMQLQA
jgi:hypothetical protein